MSIYRGAGGAGDATADSSSEALLIRDLVAEAEADAAAASASATAASGSASNASTSATNASNSATTAASYTPSQTGNAGKFLTTDGTATSWATVSGGVTSVAATVPNFLSISGSPITTSGTLAITYSGTALPVANGGTGASSLTGVLKGNGTSAFTAATAGTDFVAPSTATTFTALQTFAGTSSNADLKTSNILEVATISATAATGTIAYDVTTQSVLYYTTDASGNFTVNFRGSSGTSLNTVMATGESLSATFLVTNGATAYYNSAVQVDGNSVTPKWQGGTAPTSGNASSIDAYTYVIFKTGSATFTVLASVTKFA